MLRKLLPLAAGLMLSLSAFAANQYTLGVKGLACPYCAFGIEKRLNKIDGVDEVVVDLGDSVVRVTMAEGNTLTEDKARTAVKEAGFTLFSFESADAERAGDE